MHFPPDLSQDFLTRATVVGLHADDVTENFILGSGHGGQNRNKRSTAVQLSHHPTGTVIRCFHRRKQHENRVDAWMLLLTHLEDRRRAIETALAREGYREKAQKRGRTKKGQKKVLEEKKLWGEMKRVRRPLRP